MKNDSSSRPSRLPLAADSGPERTLFDWPRHTGTSEAVLQELDQQLRVRRRRRNRVRGALGAMALLLAGGWWWQRPAMPDAAITGPAVATASVPLRQVLPDGSVVVLRAGAELRLDFSPATRRVYIDRGEILFDVMSDPSRPFVVRAGGVDVRAVGTAFAVNRRDGRVEVLVTEGKVALERTEVPPESKAPVVVANPAPNSWGIATAQTLALIAAGHRVVVENTPSPLPPEIIAVSEQEIADLLSWRVPTLRFDRTPLREAMALINQHSRIRLVLDGDQLAEVPLSGAIRADNIEALLELLESEYRIVGEYRGETKIVLRSSP